MAKDFNDDAEELKQIMEDRNRRLKIILGVIGLGGIGTVIVPVIVSIVHL